MRTDARAASRLVTEPFSHYLIHHFKQPTSFPRRIFCAGGLHHCFAHPDRGVGGAPRDVRVFARHPLGTPYCVKDARERAYDAACQALARRLASHDAGRSPLGAPPWRFWARGRAFSHRHRLRLRFGRHPGRSQRAPRTQVVVPGGRLPCLPRRTVTSRRRRTPLPAPPSGSSPETPLNERGWESSSIASDRSQEKNTD
jgi:hypothetical protein